MYVRSAASALAIGLLSTTAMAADLPSRRAVPAYAPPVPVFSWTGAYIGGQVGYEFGKSSAYAFAPGFGGVASSAASRSGVIGGGHIGYLLATQSIPLFGTFLPNVGTGGVIGIEGDVDGSSASANYRLGGIANTGDERIQGSIRGRAGVTFDRILVYFTGGAAFGNLRNTDVNTITGGSDVLSHVRVGYTVGGGVEYAFTDNLSVRAEYRYTDYGTFTDTLINSTAGGVHVTHYEVDNRVQGGFSYKFNTPVAPVVARY